MAREAPARIDDLLSLRRAVRPRSRRARLRSSREAAHSAPPHRAGEGRSGRARHHGGADRPRCAKTPSIRRARGLCGRGLADARRPRHRRRGARARRRAVAAALRIGRRARDRRRRAISMPSPPTRRRRAAPGLRSRRAPARVIADPEFVQFHPTAIDDWRAIRPRSRPRRCAAKAPRSSTARRALHGEASIPTPSLRRATSWRAACSPKSPPGAAPSSMRATASARVSRERFPDGLR